MTSMPRSFSSSGGAPGLAVARPDGAEPRARITEATRELARRRADLVQHGRSSLERHLLGVHAVLERWGQPERVQLAGLLHSAYSTESFRYSLFSRQDRARLRELIGVDAERLVFAFCGCRRDVLLDAARNDVGSVRVATRWEGSLVQLGRRDLTDLMVLHAANLAEQTSRPSGRPASWLATASAMLAAARVDVEVPPPVFQRGPYEEMSPAQETTLLKVYRGLLPVARSPAVQDSRALEEILASSPVGEPLVLAGLVALGGGHGPEAAELGARAVTTLQTWGTAWDKRLRLARWQELALLLVRDGRKRDQELEAASRRVRMALAGANGSPQRVWARLDALQALRDREDDEPPQATVPATRAQPPDAALPPRFAAYLAGLRTNDERPLLQFYPGLTAKPWHDAQAFPIVADLERLAPRIALEARGLDASSFQDEVEDIGRTGRWSVLFLLEMGRRNDASLARCPAIQWILDHHRPLTTHAGSMYFSRLEPRSRVASHLGPTNVRVRCHLGLEVPEGCGVRVGGVTSTWQEGRCVVFDDSFPHEVWNDSDRARTVLVLDLWHPDLSEDEVALLAGLHRYGASSGQTAARFWARNDAARARLPAPTPTKPSVVAESPSLAAARRAVAESPQDAQRHLVLGNELSSVERYAEAEASIRACLAIDPTHAMAYNNLGWVREMRDDPDGAVAAYQQALALDGTCRRARRNLASLFTNLGRYREAMELRQAEVRDDPDSLPALGALVGAATRAGELRMAAELGARHAGLCRGTRWYPVARDDDPELGVPWERTVTPSKLLHDIDQLEYLRRQGVLRDELAPVITAYDEVLDTLTPLGPDARVPLVGAAEAKIGPVYNRLIHVRPTPRVARALSPSLDPRAIEDQYFSRRPNAVVVDGLLTDEAIANVRRFCLESTVWSENRYNHGRLGAMFQEGFNCPLLVQIAEELREALPRMITPDLPARQIWGYKYSSTAPKETPHADFAVVNVNFWITPDEANLDPESGGLHLYDVAAPAEWDFKTYNSNVGQKIHALLAERKAVPTHIPYRYNRAVIFDSDLIHGTPSIRFRSGYENRRINVTVLYGAREPGR